MARVDTPDRAAALPRAVWVLGSVSLFMDMSSELIHAVLPIYLTTVLGLSVAAVGAIEGLAEATASMTKLVSGALSDRTARRKPLTLAGYGLAALTKPLFPLAESALGIVAARFADRVGKGIRGAPRDAIIADVTTPDQRDAAYGLRQSLDTVGAFLGPLLAMALLAAWAGQLRAVLWVASVPAVIAVALLAFGLREPERAPSSSAKAPRLEWRALRRFPSSYWTLIAIAALFAVARLSEAFLVLRAQELQVALPLIPLVMIVMSGAYALSSYPSGLMGGAAARPARLALGLVLLLAGYAPLAFWPHAGGLWLGVALYGLHMGFTQGTLSAAVADAAPAELRATAFGAFHFVTGVFQLLGSAAAGWLWTGHGSAAAFAVGMAGAAAALVTTGRYAAATRDTARRDTR